MELKSRTKKIKLDKPLVMGVLNVTPNSFYEKGKYTEVNDAVARFDEMVKEGADIVDVGGESTGPGSKDVDAKEELKRVLPVLKKICKKRTKCWISIDTYKASVAKAALKEGVNMVNDVMALRADPALVKLLKKEKVPVVLMYSKDDNGRTSRKKPKYEDVVNEVKTFLKKRIKFAKESGIAAEQIILDPGQGAFISMDPAESCKILKRLKEFRQFGHPVLVGSSRKSFIGEVLDLPLEERLEGSLACATAAILNGASIIRTHDVAATRRAVDMAWAIKNS
ncbi:dihydropteroate synthase [Patescibacteria group bacterium]